MPIYEFLCRRCNVIFQFLIRSSDDGSRSCPRCGGTEMERVMSRFSTSRKGSPQSSGGGEDLPDLSGIDENDPRSMARAIRHMADEMGEDLGPELDEAITRLEAGEDPEKIERELEDAGLGEGDGEGGCSSCEPTRDPGLY
jgi:putative FmdB family regulatory protein